MDPMLESFITESRENLETAGRCFLALEKTPDDEALLNNLFRSIHTIKGSSGLFDIPAFTKVVHAAEDVLDTVRCGELTLTSEHIDLFLDTMDQVSAWLDDLENTETLAEGAESSSQSLAHALRILLGEIDVSESNEENTRITSTENSVAEPTDKTLWVELPDWLSLMPDDSRLISFKRATEETLEILAIEYTPDSQCFFSGEDPLHTIRSLPGLVWFHTLPREPWSDPVAMDPYQCNLIFYAVATGDESEIQHYLRYITEQIRVTKLLPLQFVLPTGETGDNEPFGGFINEAPQVMAQQDWALLRRLIAPLLEISGSELLQTSALRWMGALLQQQNPDPALLDALLNTVVKGEFQWPDSLDHERASIDIKDEDTPPASESAQVDNTASQSQLSEAQLKAVAHVLVTQKQILSMPCTADLFAGRIASVSTVVTNLLYAANIQTDGLKQAVEAAQSQKSANPLVTFLADLSLNPLAATEKTPDPIPEVSTALPLEEQCQGGERRRADRRRGNRRQDNTLPVTEDASTAPSQTLKVDQQRIDVLMDLVGELVVAKNALPFLARRAEDDFGIRPLAKEIKAQYAVINRLSEELQSTMMQIRMVPVSNVFQRFPRLVRDLSRKLNKQINLVLEGEETEADKNVVENLADPLIHLVRNSLDHGLETAQERQAAGKSAQGTIILRAIPHDDQVVIEVIDDGRGIDPEVIKRKAYEKGIIDEHRLDIISDQDALQLILAAGFSTAEEISDLSGRGVGMDVVHSVVSEAGGHVLVNSEKGQGSTVRLSLPLSMAVSRVMMIEVAGQCYGVSMEHIVETVRLPAEAIQRIKQCEVVVLRDRLIPLFHLRHLLQLEPIAVPPGEVAVLVMILGGEEVGLVIDEFHEGIDIIQKPLEGVMANYPYYSGTALLGDGRVLLVLNAKELLACR